jgi:hypothetical protein
MILTTTCNPEEFTLIKARALNLGIQVTASPGFIYKKGNWIVGNTRDTEASFNKAVESRSVTPQKFMDELKANHHRMTSLAVITRRKEQRDRVVEYFLEKDYTITEELKDGLAIFVVPAVKGLLITFESIAEVNRKDNNYVVIDYETFLTIAG